MGGDCGQKCGIWIFSVKFATLGTGKLFKSDNISLSAFKKTIIWGKICGRQSGNKGSVQMLHPCCTPHLCLNIFVPASQGCALAEPGGHWCPTFALRCWVPYILQVQSTWLPSIFLRSQPFITLTAEVLERSRMVTTQILLKEYQPGIEYSDDYR